MKLTDLRRDAPRDRFPVCVSNRGRTHFAGYEVAERLGKRWTVSLIYEPDSARSRQGTFYLDASKLTDLEIEGIHCLILKELNKYLPAT